MRLIHTSSLQLKEVPSHDPPPYAILSHTWGPPEEEVLFEDMTPDLRTARLKPAFNKMKFACDQARADHLDYCWIDTCCIDKRSSAELQESINSMFMWYKKAVVCYAYLFDVDKISDFGLSSELSKTRWFTRGWTLQELLAPRSVEFYSKMWHKIGSKGDITIRELIRKATNIPDEVLRTGSLEDCCTAQRMSWAAKRETSRPEDIAYCLMGLFSVNMPLLYGEGRKAFRRLQEEIIKRTYDRSIFAWRDSSISDGFRHGLFADTPSQFDHSGEVVSQIDSPRGEYLVPREERAFAITNAGIEIMARLLRLQDNVYIMPIYCILDHDKIPGTRPTWTSWVCIVLEYTWGEFARISNGHFALARDLPVFYQAIVIRDTFKRGQETTDRYLESWDLQLNYSITGTEFPTIPYPIILHGVDGAQKRSVIGWTVQLSHRKKEAQITCKVQNNHCWIIRLRRHVSESDGFHYGTFNVRSAEAMKFRGLDTDASLHRGEYPQGIAIGNNTDKLSVYSQPVPPVDSSQEWNELEYAKHHANRLLFVIRVIMP